MSGQTFRIFDVEQDLIKANEKLAKEIQKVFTRRESKLLILWEP